MSNEEKTLARQELKNGDPGYCPDSRYLAILHDLEDKLSPRDVMKLLEFQGSTDSDVLQEFATDLANSSARNPINIYEMRKTGFYVPYPGRPNRPAIDTYVTLRYLQAERRVTIDKKDENDLSAFLISFDLVLRKLMNYKNKEISDLAKNIDVKFATYLLKFTNMISNADFRRLIEIMETPSIQEIPLIEDFKTELRDLIKILKGLKSGALKDFSDLLNNADCDCILCRAGNTIVI